MKYKDIMEMVIKQKLKNRYIDLQPGGSCCTIKKLTEKYVILKGCHYSWEYKYYFDFKDDIDDKILYYLLKKYHKSHFMFKPELSIQADYSRPKKLSNKQKEKLVGEIVKQLGTAYLSDISEILEINPIEVIPIFKKLNEKNKIKEKK